MSRFEEAVTEVTDKVQQVIRTKFPSLNGCNIEVVMDTKKRKSGGQFQLVKLDKASPILRHISATNSNPEGVDYILYLDQKVYGEMSDTDRERIIAHGLYHADCDFEKEIPYGVRKPTVQTFYEEIADNDDDARWAERLDLMAEQLYEAEAEASG
jgi:hypothetical protein